MTNTEIFLNNLSSKVGMFLMENKHLRERDKEGIEQLFTELNNTITIELVKRDIIENDLTARVVEVIDNRHSFWVDFWANKAN